MAPFSCIKDYSGFGAFGIIVIIFYLFVISCFHYKKKGYNFFKSYLIFIIYIVFIIWLMITFKTSLSFANEGWIVPILISTICEIIDYKRYKTKTKNYSNRSKI